MIHTVGDSHATFGWTNVLKHHFGQILCYSFGRDKLLRCDIRNLFGTKDGDTIIFCFGEIDCRCHVHKHITEDYSYQMIIDSMIDNYFEAIKLNIQVCETQFKNVCVFNVVPPVRKHTTFENPNYPFRGTDEERLSYVLHFNKKAKEKCLEYGYVFFDVFDQYSDDDGFLREDKSDKHVHIQDGTHLNEFLQELIK